MLNYNYDTHELSHLNLSIASFKYTVYNLAHVFHDGGNGRLIENCMWPIE